MQQLFRAAASLIGAIVVSGQKLHVAVCILRHPLHPINSSGSVRRGEVNSGHGLRDRSVPLCVLFSIGLVVIGWRTEWLSPSVVVHLVADLKRQQMGAKTFGYGPRFFDRLVKCALR